MKARSRRVVIVTTVPETLPFMRAQISELERAGFEVHCVSSPGELLERFAESSKVRVHGVRMERRIDPLSDLRALRELVRLLRELEPVLVHSSTPKGGLLGTTAATIVRAPRRLYHMRGLPMDTAKGLNKAILWSTEALSCALAHRVIAVGKSVRDHAVARRICAEGKITILAGGSGQGVDAGGRFDPDRFSAESKADIRARLSIPATAIVVGFVGRLVSEKGIPELHAAWSRLRERHTNLELLLVGPPEPRDPVPPEVLASLQSDPRVHLTGHVLDPAEYMSIMDLLVLPTHREGFPNVPLEAAAMRLPVVASDIAACREAVAHGVTGRLFPTKDSVALERAIERYATNEVLRREHGARGRERVLAEFSAARSAEALLVEYRRLLSEIGL
ncbi:MAG: glycosyltransferase family 4 protein [Deltaproteobacteria bacterium]|nr:glycosyltransferase family 4 protein [Deltaproteobacteria bacterium]